MLTVFFRRLL